MLVAVVSLLAVAVGCSGDGREITVPVGDGITPSTAPPTTGGSGTGEPGTLESSPTDEPPGAGESPGPGSDVVLVAVAADDLRVRASPQLSAPVVETLSPAQELSGAVVSVVTQQLGDDWLEVLLPSAPAGHTGWIRRDDVLLSRHRFRIEVSRSQHSLTVHAGEVVALTAPVAIGTADVPPAGTPLFIKDLVEPPDPGGPYRSYAYGLAGWSNDLDDFRAGSGVVAIHGAGDPSTLGRDVPTGSIAVDSAIISRMVGTIGLPLGTPVAIIE
jgi:lipoprotein-anchoring transpeptidase ErfK/SrfK